MAVPATGAYGPDGGMYVQVARHVASGAGLRTNFSMDQGLQSFPGPATIYPLWPLVLGCAARLIDLELAARLLPVVCYFLALVLLYVLANEIMRGWRGSDGVAGSSASFGHAAVLLFGLNPIFFRYTSFPYTEGLALACMFASLVALVRYADTRRLGWSAVAGALAACSYLARTQMLPLVAGVVVSSAIAGARGGGGGDRLRAAAVASLASLAVVAPWLWFLSRLPGDVHPTILFDFTAYSETPELPRLDWVVDQSSLTALLADRARGVLVAYDWTDPSSFVRSFGLSTYAVPLGVVLWVLSPAVRRALHGWSDVAVFGTLLCGIGVVLTVHYAHRSAEFEPWAFGHRPGLPFILLELNALAFLLVATRQSGPIANDWARLSLRGVVILLFVASLTTSARQTVQEASRGLRPYAKPPRPSELALAEWLDTREPPPVVVAHRALRWSAISRRAGFHWIGCGDDAERLKRIFTFTDAEFLVVQRGDRRCRYMQDDRVSFERVARFPGRRGQQIDVLRLRDDDLASSPPSE